MANKPVAPQARSGLSPEQEQTWFAYMRVALRLNFELNRHLQTHSELSLSDFHVLNALADSADQHLPISDLAVRIGWTCTSITSFSAWRSGNWSSGAPPIKTPASLKSPSARTAETH